VKQKKGNPIRRNVIKIAVLCFWLLVWELLSLYLGSDILLASPISVLQTLLQLIVTVDFWQTILFSSLRIVAGFVLSMLVGTVLAIAAFRFSLLEELLSPLMKMIKTMPVASFIILALIWINSKNLSVLISFMMGLPMIYSNVMLGLRAADPKLLELAKVYGIGPVKKALAIYLPSTTPFLLAAISVGVGFCWKAGIAAEVIGVPSGSIGERLYEAKLYLMTKELLAWTIVIIIISAIFEKAVLWLLQSDRRERRH
jgi:NitT/TauT family transport system permease protein